MSADVATMQAQVETLLGALVRAASVELIKLFESRYRAEPELRPGAGGVRSADGRRSVGVQVEEDIEFDPALLLDVKSLRNSSEVKLEGHLVPLEVQLAEDTEHHWEPPKKQITADALETLEQENAEADSLANDDGQNTDVSPVSEAGSGTSTSDQRSPAKHKPLLIQPDTRATASGEEVKFVCPLILQPDTSVPESSEKPAHAEPQPACVSTAKGTAYSPSSSDGAVTPAPVGVWARIQSPKEATNHLQLKLKLTSPDQKLLQPCSVQLVDLLTIPKSKPEGDEAAKALVANNKSGTAEPKDLRRHQGPHTGHRLCCFTRCGDDVWRLQNIVTHSRAGYVCSACGKAFKRRKILRRHERFHSGEKPYACSKCPKKFALRKSLRRHLRFHTDERPHACSQCGKSFRLRENLKAHLRFHSGEKPFSCAGCGKTFRIMRNMEKHKLGQCVSFVPSFRTIAGLSL